MTESEKQQALMRRALDELRELRGQLVHYQQAAHEPIAVLAIGCRFPGACDSPEALWQFLAEGKNARGEVPEQRWSLAEYYAEPAQTPGKISSRYGAFLSDIDRFDADFFAIAAREAEQMDPQQRLLLETSWQAFERAGIHPKTLRNSRSGVYIGCMTQEYAELIKDDSAIDVHTGTGNAPSILAGRLAYYYGMQGPAMVIDTACSSSLLAVHLAVKSLRGNEIDMALVGGVNLQLSPRAAITESQAMMLAADGLCKTFDAKADGIGRGDGVGLVVLKRLSDALAAGDPICAVIKGSAANHDGRSSGLTVPSERAQEAVLKAALADALLTAADVGYIEAHGTGTALGDPIEVGALNSVLGGDRAEVNPLYIGSLKTNFGHMEGAAGIAGLIKVVLMLQQRMLLPHLNFTTPSAHIPWQAIPLKVVAGLAPWPVAEGQSRVAGVSAFGLSGTNAHVLLAEAPARNAEHPAERGRGLALKLSANSEASLTALAAAYQHWLAAHDADLHAVCYRAAVSRADLKHRALIVATDRQQIEQALSALATGRDDGRLYRSGQGRQKPKLAMVFSGQGSQYPGMAQDLYRRWPVFRQTIDQCAEYLQKSLPIPLQQLLFDSSDAQLQQTCYAQPAIFAVDYALFRLWQSWGIEPDAVMGNSLGEYVAACVAGVFSLEQAINLVVARAQLMQQAPSGGAMLAVAAGREEVGTLLAANWPELDIAAVNSPRHCVLAGSSVLIEQARQYFSESAVQCTPLAVSHAFHSRMMEPVLPALRQVFEQAAYGKAFMPLVSNVTGRIIGDDIVWADYWLQHCRQPVAFADNVAALRQLGCDVFLECGAKPVLAPMLSANAIEAERIFASLQPKQADSVLHCAARLYTGGFDLNWQAIFGDAPNVCCPPLPVYPFSGKRYWLPDSALKNRRVETTQTLSPLLSKRLALADSESVYFETWLAPREQVYLSEHQVFGRLLAPFAVLLEILCEAGQQLSKSSALALKNLRIERPLLLSRDSETQLQIKAKAVGGQYQLGIFSRLDAAGWHRHISAETDVCMSFTDFEAPAAGDERQSLAADKLYRQFRQKDIVYGETFKVLESIEIAGQTVFAGFKPRACEPGHLLHPAIWDGCLQTAGIAVGETAGDETWLPIAVERIDFYRPLEFGGSCLARLSSRADRACQVDVILKDRENLTLAMQGVSFQPLAKQALAVAADQRPEDWLCRPGWTLLADTDLTEQPAGEHVLCIGTATANRLLAKLGTQVVGLSLMSPEQLRDSGYWRDFSPSSTSLHLVYCAEDFLGEEDSSVCLGFLTLVQTLEIRNIAAKVTLLTRGGAVIDLEAVCPKQSACVALLKTAALEFPQRIWQALDVDAIDTAENGKLARLLSGISGEQQLALRGGQCYAARLLPWRPENRAALTIAADKTYLVTGGSGALGFAVVEWLVEHGADSVLIASRKGLTAIDPLKLQALAAQGAKIIGVAADLAQAEGVSALMAQLQSLPPLAGIVHAAGALSDASLLTMNQADFERPWRAKVSALRFLDQSFPELAFFAVFSSLAALTGAPGQGNYAAANAYADALMLNRKHQGLAALTINWGGWSGEGMLAGAAEAMAEKGLALIQPRQGLALFERLLTEDLPQAAVMPVDWPVFFAALPFEVPNYYRTMAANEAGHDTQSESLIQQWRQSDAARRPALLEQAVRQGIAQVLRNPESLGLAPRQRLFDIGFDSLLAMELSRKLGQTLELRLASTMLFDYPTIEALLAYLSQQLATEFGAEEEPLSDNLDDFSEQQLSALLERRLAAMD
ncbi:SDR family NAD(P)-dependent oxidoreductase [Methylococcaceae bacterium WWC4]|nr:SDR family NAD(P)-dependent oxidoreductase [Methylococcaceae bacterium WWC4]